MKSRLIRLLIPVLALLLVMPVCSCERAEKQVPAAPAASELSNTLVPNTNLDVYIYIKQENPTNIPAEMINARNNIAVVSLAVWGVPAENDFAFGFGLTLTNPSDASNLYAAIPTKDGWKKVSGNTLYFVQGSGAAAESLKAAISRNDFKRYDNRKSLEALATLPSGGKNKVAGVALIHPSKELIGLFAKDADAKGSQLRDMILNVVRLDVIAAGLYSPQQIDIMKVRKALESSGTARELEMGLLILVKSGLPGFAVEPIVKKFLTESKFTETNLGGLTLYQGTLPTKGEAIPVLVRIESNRIFAAISGQQSYAETLIKSIKME